MFILSLGFDGPRPDMLHGPRPHILYTPPPHKVHGPPSHISHGSKPPTPYVLSIDMLHRSEPPLAPTLVPPGHNSPPVFFLLFFVFLFCFHVVVFVIYLIFYTCKIHMSYLRMITVHGALWFILKIIHGLTYRSYMVAEPL